MKNLDKTANEVRKSIIELSYRSRKAHISSSLSIADILVVLYWDVLKLKGNRDYFLLSKGHAAPALYAVLRKMGIIGEKLIKTYGKNGSLLGVHPESKVPGIDFSTGSLGHGLSVGVGLALGIKNDRKSNKVFVLLSDAECQEGSVWEGALFASSHKLDNLIAIVDYNNSQAFGKTNEVTKLEPFKDKWLAFGWNAVEVDGHNTSELSKAFKKLASGKPTVLICKTLTGKGISFMEGEIKWHYLNLNDETYHHAMQELNK